MATETSKVGLTVATYGDLAGAWASYWAQDSQRIDDRLATQYAGNPSGNVAGYWEGQLCTDTTNNISYICTATGPAATASWTLLTTWLNTIGDIDALTAYTDPAVGDLFAAWDLSASGNRTISFSNYLKVIAGLTAMTASDIDLANDIVLLYDASASDIRRGNPNHFSGLSKVVGRTVIQYSTYTTVTTVIPSDNTIPQITEGTEIFSGSYAASATTNKLRIEGRVNTFTTGAGGPIAALFAGGAADAIWAGAGIASANRQGAIPILHEFFPTATTAITYAVRVGNDDADAGANLFINGDASAALFGGVNISELVITEFKP